MYDDCVQSHRQVKDDLNNINLQRIPMHRENIWKIAEGTVQQVATSCLSFTL
jgi:hypothetical protein